MLCNKVEKHRCICLLVLEEVLYVGALYVNRAYILGAQITEQEEGYCRFSHQMASTVKQIYKPPAA